MAEYLEYEKVLDDSNIITVQTKEYGSIEVIPVDTITDIELADVQPVKHGYWIKQPEKFQIHEDVINSNYLYSCSCCNASDLHSERANNDGEVKFCWRCGAKMDLPEPIKG